MNPADLRRRWPAAKAFTSAAALRVFLSATLILCTGILLVAPPRAAAAGALTVTMDRSLTLLDETTAITASGDTIASLTGSATLAVRIAGPATISDLAQTDPPLPEAGSYTVAADSLPSVARPSASEIHLPMPFASLPAAPGAYRITVEVRSGNLLMAEGSTWMGRVATRSSPLDLAFVWRAVLGVHLGSDGGLLRRGARTGVRARRGACHLRRPTRFGRSLRQVSRLAFQPGTRTGTAHATARHGGRLHADG